MDYPKEKLNVWLLDDGGTDQKCNDKNPAKAEAAKLRRASLQELCKRLGAHYLTRAKQRARQGRQHEQRARPCEGRHRRWSSTPTTRPSARSCRRRSPISSTNRNCFWSRRRTSSSIPIRSRKICRTFSRMPSENEMFYSMTQRGLDKWDALLLLRLGGAAASLGADGGRRLLRRHDHGRLRDGLRAPRQGLIRASSSTSRSSPASSRKPSHPSSASACAGARGCCRS